VRFQILWDYVGKTREASWTWESVNCYVHLICSYYLNPIHIKTWLKIWKALSIKGLLYKKVSLGGRTLKVCSVHVASRWVTVQSKWKNTAKTKHFLSGTLASSKINTLPLLRIHIGWNDQNQSQQHPKRRLWSLWNRTSFWRQRPLKSTFRSTLIALQASELFSKGIPMLRLECEIQISF
jgi:hypothetical protein